MRLAASLVILVAACGGAAPTVETGIAPPEPLPDHIADHDHAAPAHADDTSKLYVEITSDGDHGDVLKQSATSGLTSVPYVVSVDAGGDVELHVELASLTPAPKGAACKVKIFVLRLPQHDLLAIADGAANATGSGQSDTCLSATGTAIVKQKLPVLLQRQLDAKK